MPCVVLGLMTLIFMSHLSHQRMARSVRNRSLPTVGLLQRSALSGQQEAFG
jgi:hypothetical protein